MSPETILKQVVTAHLEAHEHALRDSFTNPQINTLTKIANEICKVLKKGNKLLICGNGGSAADAQHIAAEFVGRFKLERKSLPAIALTTDTSILTAIANDYSFERIFSRQVEGLGNKGDLLIAISTSGNSLNIIDVVRYASKRKIFTVVLTGRTGGALKGLADISFCVSSDMTPYIQEMHITALHAICEAVDMLLFPSS